MSVNDGMLARGGVISRNLTATIEEAQRRGPYAGSINPTLGCQGIQEPQSTVRTSGVLVDGGERQDFESGAMREPAAGKGRYDLISPLALHRLAQHYENGAAKYAERNWEKGLPASRMFDSAMRHLIQYLTGNAEEDHLAAAVWNIFCIMDFEQRMPEMLESLPMRWQFNLVKGKDELK